MVIYHFWTSDNYFCTCCKKLSINTVKFIYICLTDRSENHTGGKGRKISNKSNNLSAQLWWKVFRHDVRYQFNFSYSLSFLLDLIFFLRIVFTAKHFISNPISNFHHKLFWPFLIKIYPCLVLDKMFLHIKHILYNRYLLFFCWWILIQQFPGYCFFTNWF